MSAQPTELNTLGSLLKLRHQGVNQVMARIQYQQQLCQRYRSNIEGLNRLLGYTVPMTTPLQRDNQQRYKQVLLRVAEVQQRELTIAEQQLETIRQELLAASLDEKRLEKVLEIKLAQWQESLGRQEQKLQDALASQSWIRRDAV